MESFLLTPHLSLTPLIGVRVRRGVPCSSLYANTNIVKYAYTYDDYQGLRKTMTEREGSGTGWGSARTEEYRYEADLDYLTEVDCDTSGGYSADATWTYDAAGNRSNSGYTYNDLNMMTASPGATYEHDILGNRTYRNPQSYTTWRYVWDIAGRMTKAAGPSSGATYSYRADGMRTKKVTGLTLEWIDDEETASGYYDEHQDTNHPTWRYRYDGQMCMDEDFTTGAGGGSVTGSAYGLGARGFDMIRPFTVSGGTRSYGEAQFPIYDGHGNMKATLSRSGSSPWYAISNSRSYDVWGGVRSGASSGDPNTRYCANLGHKQDDESGLIYMRARYYEPGTGRFVSQDPARDGANWYGYCGNNPVSNLDPSGAIYLSDATLRKFLMDLSLNILQGGLQAKMIASAALLFMQTWLTWEIFTTPIRDVGHARKRSWISTFQGEVSVTNSPGYGGVRERAEAVIDTYAIMLVLSMWVLDESDGYWLN